MEFTPLTYALAIAAGFVAGVINTVAGSGSLVTLPLLVFLGLPVHVANATNRVGVTIQNIVGLLTLRHHGALELRQGGWYIVPTLVGAAVGANVAADIDERMLRYAIGGIMVVMLFVLLVRPERWVEPPEQPATGAPPWYVLLGAVAIGFYGGFVQAGVGILLLVALVLGAGLGAMHANALKLFLTLCFTAVSLAVFAWKGQVAWAVGFVVAIGQALGAYVAARFLAGSERAGVWIRRFLIAVVAVSSLEFFGLV